MSDPHFEAVADLEIPFPDTALVRWDQSGDAHSVHFSPNLHELLGRPADWIPLDLPSLADGAQVNRLADRPVREFLAAPFMLCNENGIVQLRYFMNDRWLELRAQAVERNRDLVSIAAIVQLTKPPGRSQNDEMTGLFNKPTFQRIGEDVLRGATPERRTVLIRMDLNRFKAINDAYGHPAGDLVLISFARRLQLITDHWLGRAEAGRLGGDEFALIGYRLKEEEVDRLARECLHESSYVMRVPDNSGKSVRVAVKASIGVAVSTGEVEDYETFDRMADAALYWGKKGGRRDRLRYYSQELFELSREELSQTAMVNASLSLQEITPRYEPIVDNEGRVVGIEALSRWFTRRGLMLPEQYFPELLYQDMMIEHDFQILHQAAWDAVRIHRESGRWLDLHSNITPAALGSPDFITNLKTVLKTTGLPPGRLVLEVLECDGLPPYSQMAGNLACLEDLGVRLAMDDYPDDHSNTLRLLEVGTFRMVKLSGSLLRFVNGPADIDPERRRRAVNHLQREIDRFHDLGYLVVAEHIDTFARLCAAQDLGVDLMQGYLFGAMPAPDDGDEPDVRYALSRDRIVAFIASEPTIQELMLDSGQLVRLSLAGSA